VPVIDTFCLTCGCVTVFEQPPCTEKKHDGNCPEWICKRCGAAVLIGAWPAAPARARAAA
jgi:hypothetical protein